MDWITVRDRLGAPMYAPLRAALEKLPRGRWPDHADLTAAAHGLETSRGMPLRFVPPRAPDIPERRYYELHIAQTGEVETRPGNAHDLFNALAWMAYPRAKAMINAQHAAIFEERGDEEAKRRGPERDALTLFDEGGVAVLCTDPALLQLIVDFEWKELFWRRRAELERSVRFHAFGHALFENGLQPHLGMVAKTVFLVDALDADVDAALATHFSERARFASPRMMAPMPVLGIPGWHEGTAREDFYDDRRHFRPKTRPAGA